MNKNGEEQKFYKAAGNLTMNIVRKCPPTGACESEKQPLQELLNHMPVKGSKESIKKTV